MKFTKEEYETLSGVIDEMKGVVINRAGLLSASLSKAVDTIGKQHYPLLCSTCTSGRITIIDRLYSDWLEDYRYYRDNKQTNKEEKIWKSDTDTTQKKTSRRQRSKS